MRHTLRRMHVHLSFGHEKAVGKQEIMAAEALEKSALESKDKDQLMAIAEALGVKAPARASKATLVEKILEKTGVGAAPAPAKKAGRPAKAEAPTEEVEEKPAREPRNNDRGARNNRNGDGEESAKPSNEPVVYLGDDGEPLAEWEIELAQHEGRLDQLKTAGGGQRNDRGDRGPRQQGQGQGQHNQNRHQSQTVNKASKVAIGKRAAATVVAVAVADAMVAMKDHKATIATTLVAIKTNPSAWIPSRWRVISIFAMRVTASCASVVISQRATTHTFR